MSELTYRIGIEQVQDGLQWELVATGIWIPTGAGYTGAVRTGRSVQ